ncbi:MAG: ketol-acid reductoisomerase [Candidatus Sericytochromatia bacterium]|nr:ketol-acid reductoisomerase [Candidatus Sericytochromatia bacterium]
MTGDGLPPVWDEGAVAVLGYGAQGRAHALNLKDSGAAVRIGLHAGARRAESARADGFVPGTVRGVIPGASMVALMVPDEVIPIVLAQVADLLEPGVAVVLAHGYSYRYAAAPWREDLDALLVAPMGQGRAVRDAFLAGGGVPAFLAVHHDATGKARVRAEAYARALGAHRAGLHWGTVAQETEVDLFAEQAVLVGGVETLVREAFSVLVEAGYPEDVAYFSCLHELKLVVDLMHEEGLGGMARQISNTAEFGALRARDQYARVPVREAMERLLAEIRDGTFATAWSAEAAAGLPRLAAAREATAAAPLERVGEALRARLARNRV